MGSRLPLATCLPSAGAPGPGPFLSVSVSLRLPPADASAGGRAGLQLGLLVPTARVSTEHCTEQGLKEHFLSDSGLHWLHRASGLGCFSGVSMTGTVTWVT